MAENALTADEEVKEIEKYIKYVIKNHVDAFEEIHKHTILYGAITEEEIERIVLASLNKRKG